MTDQTAPPGAIIPNCAAEIELALATLDGDT